MILNLSISYQSHDNSFPLLSSGAAGALLVYDISNRDTFNALLAWLQDAKALASPDIIILMIGNKKDLDDERQVSFMEASNFAQENGTH